MMKSNMYCTFQVGEDGRYSGKVIGKDILLFPPTDGFRDPEVSKQTAGVLVRTSILNHSIQKLGLQILIRF